MKKMRECEKAVLAETAGFRIVYCAKCQVVELEVGAFSLRLAPDVMRHFANVLMKGSLKLERLTHSGLYESSVEKPQVGTLH